MPGTEDGETPTARKADAPAGGSGMVFTLVEEMRRAWPRASKPNARTLSATARGMGCGLSSGCRSKLARGGGRDNPSSARTRSSSSLAAAIASVGQSGGLGVSAGWRFTWRCRRWRGPGW